MIYYKPTQSVFQNRKALKSYLYDRYASDIITRPTADIYDVLFACALRRGEVVYMDRDGNLMDMRYN